MRIWQIASLSSPNPIILRSTGDRNLVKRISSAAGEMQRKPLLRSVIVNKATEAEEKGGHLDLETLESSFRLELVKEFPLEFRDTHAVPVDLEALKAYKTQRIPYLASPASLFSFATLSAFRDILQISYVKVVCRAGQLVESIGGRHL